MTDVVVTPDGGLISTVDSFPTIKTPFLKSFRLFSRGATGGSIVKGGPLIRNLVAKAAIIKGQLVGLSGYMAVPASAGVGVEAIGVADNNARVGETLDVFLSCALSTETEGTPGDAVYSEADNDGAFSLVSPDPAMYMVQVVGTYLDANTVLIKPALGVPAGS